MRRVDLLTVSLLALAVGGCATGRFRQVSYAGEASQLAEDSSRVTVHVVRNTEMKDTVLEARIRAHLEDFLLKRGFIVSPADTAQLYVLATYGSGQRIVGTTAAVFRPADTRVQRSPSGQVVGRTYNPDRMEYRRVPLLENSVWLMVLSSDARFFRQTGRVRNLWRGEAAMRGTPEAMADAVPYLIVPTLKYFGKGTFQTLLMDVREKDRAWQ